MRHVKPFLILLLLSGLYQPWALIASPENIALNAAPTNGPLTLDELVLHLRATFEKLARERPDAALEQLREGFLAYLGKDYARAIKMLSYPNIFQETSLGDYAYYLLGASYHEMGAHAEAKARFEKLIASCPDSILASSARLRLASCQKDLGNFQAALRTLGDLATIKYAPLLLVAAECYEALGDRSQARQVYETIYYEFPTSDEANSAKAKLRSLRALPRGSGRFSEKSLKRVDLLLDAGRNRDALNELTALSKLSGLARDKLSLRLGRCYYGLRQYTRALPYLKRASASGDTATCALALYYLARCYNYLDRFSDLINTVQQMTAQHPSHPLTESSLYLLAVNYESKRDFAQARETLLCLKERFPQGSYRERTAWKLAWFDYLEGKYKEAAAGFERYLESWPSEPSHCSALFWLGRTYERLQNIHKARSLYQAVLKESPNSLYGSLARQRLSQLIDLHAQASSGLISIARADTSAADGTRGLASASSLSGDNAAPAVAWLRTGDQVVSHIDRRNLEIRLTKFRQLYSIGFESWALRELEFLTADRDALVRLYFNWPDAPTEVDPLERIRTLRRFLPNYYAYEADTLPRQIWEAFYPLPMWSEIKAAAERHGLDPYLVAALIRQESTFSPQAVSRARAIGLMQILPSTGRQIARQLGYQRLTTRKLYDPRINLSIGAYYLSRLLEKFNGEVALALAAYNGGANRVSAWIERYATEDVYELIESIPVTETREYVKMVLTSAMHYRRLYGGN